MTEEDFWMHLGEIMEMQVWEKEKTEKREKVGGSGVGLEDLHTRAHSALKVRAE